MSEADVDESRSKACTKCGEVKSLDEFHYSRDNRDGRRGACKVCSVAAATANARKRRESLPLPTVFPELKHCKRCDTTKAAAEFYVNRISVDGLTIYCKACSRASAKASAERRLKAGPRVPPEPKACSGCGEVKEPSDFYPRPVAFDGLFAECAECCRARSRAWKLANPAKVAEYQSLYNLIYREERLAASKRWREANPERRREYARQYDLANAERVAAWKRGWYEANREVVLERLRTDPSIRQRRQELNRASAERNRDVRAERQRKRRVDRLGLTIEDVDLDALWTGRCGICGQLLDRDLRWPDPLSKSIDHTVPLSRGGTHEAHNLTWAHLFCNISKGDRMPE
jgi:5-methylcytosine-specific restriction endonuclease McrA